MKLISLDNKEKAEHFLRLVPQTDRLTSGPLARCPVTPAPSPGLMARQNVLLGVSTLGLSLAGLDLNLMVGRLVLLSSTMSTGMESSSTTWHVTTASLWSAKHECRNERK